MALAAYPRMGLFGQMMRSGPTRFGVHLLALVAMVQFTPACSKTPPATPPSGTSTPAPAPAPAPAPVAALDLTKVQGSWMRQDGGYRLVIGVIGEDGHARSEYFNPNPIKVAWTKVRVEDGVIKADLELRDTNYPGCIYKLTYDAAGDRLVGTYFQAQLQETYEIIFARN